MAKRKITLVNPGAHKWTSGREWGIVAENPSDKKLIAIAQGGR